MTLAEEFLAEFEKTIDQMETDCEEALEQIGDLKPHEREFILNVLADIDQYRISRDRAKRLAAGGASST